MNKIRSTHYLSSIGIDGGLYLGGRVYLKINALGRVHTFEKISGSLNWKSLDITDNECGF
jgi:hypothetical protein